MKTFKTLTEGLSHKVPVYHKPDKLGEYELVGHVSSGATSIGAAKLAKKKSAKFSRVDGKYAWVASDDLKESVLDVPTHSPETLAKKHGVSVAHIHAQLKKGIDVEHEHTSDSKVAREIALDHLGEKPDYYSKLDKARLEESVDHFPGHYGSVGYIATQHGYKFSHHDKAGDHVFKHPSGDKVVEMSDPNGRWDHFHKGQHHAKGFGGEDLHRHLFQVHKTPGLSVSEEFTHAQHAKKHKTSSPCSAHDQAIGGGCYNCGYDPETQSKKFDYKKFSKDRAKHPEKFIAGLEESLTPRERMSGAERLKPQEPVPVDRAQTLKKNITQAQHVTAKTRKSQAVHKTILPPTISETTSHEHLMLFTHDYHPTYKVKVGGQEGQKYQHVNGLHSIVLHPNGDWHHHHTHSQAGHVKIGAGHGVSSLEKELVRVHGASKVHERMDEAYESGSSNPPHEGFVMPFGSHTEHSYHGFEQAKADRDAMAKHLKSQGHKVRKSKLANQLLHGSYAHVYKVSYKANLEEARLHHTLKGHPYHYKSDAELHYIIKDAHEAEKAVGSHDKKAMWKYADQQNDAASILGYRQRGGKQLQHPKPSMNEAYNVAFNESGAEGYKVGDKVIPKIGPHKGTVHTVIHVHPTGHLNIKPEVNVRSNRYHLGAAKADPKDVEHVPVSEESTKRAFYANKQEKDPAKFARAKHPNDITREKVKASKEWGPWGSWGVKKGINSKTVQEAFQAAKDKKNGKQDNLPQSQEGANEPGKEQPDAPSPQPQSQGGDAPKTQDGGQPGAQQKKDNAPKPEASKNAKRLVPKGEEQFQADPYVTPLTTLPDTASPKSGNQGVR